VRGPIAVTESLGAAIYGSVRTGPNHLQAIPRVWATEFRKDLADEQTPLSGKIA
jgi:hypothetical protein